MGFTGMTSLSLEPLCYQASDRNMYTEGSWIREVYWVLVQGSNLSYHNRDL